MMSALIDKDIVQDLVSRSFESIDIELVDQVSPSLANDAERNIG